MKINVKCDEYKTSGKTGSKQRCSCVYLNSNFKRELKYFKMLVKNLK